MAFFYQRDSIVAYQKYILDEINLGKDIAIAPLPQPLHPLGTSPNSEKCVRIIKAVVCYRNMQCEETLHGIMSCVETSH